MIATDEKLAPESSPVADADLTLADVDFGDVQKDVLDYMSGKTPAAKQAVVDETPKPADPAPASDAKAEPEAPKPAPKMLTEADVDRMVKERLAEATKQPPKEDPEPLLSEDRFKDHDEWAKEMAAWTKRENARAIDASDAKREAEAQTQREHAADVERRTKSWNDRCEAAKARIPDFDEITARGKAIPITDEMIAPLQFMSESPVGPELWVHYIRNEIDRNKLLAMSTDDQKLELRFMERDLTRNPPPPPAKTVSDAPAPPRSMPGRATSGDQTDSDEYEPVKSKVLKWMKNTE